MRIVTREPQSTDTLRGQQLTDLLIAAGQFARARDAIFVLLLDETQNADRTDLGNVCHALQQAQTVTNAVIGPRGEREHHHLPIVAYLAGLPGLTQAIRGAGATSFERAVPQDFGLLSDSDIIAALIAFAANENVGVNGDALERLLHAIGGYPYFLHLIGKHVWSAGTQGAVITDADAIEGINTAQPDIARFYGGRLRGLGEVQYRWLQTAAHLPDDQRTVGNVAQQLHAAGSSQYGWLVDSLIERGLLRHARGRGHVEFTLPGMANYLQHP